MAKRFISNIDIVSGEILNDAKSELLYFQENRNILKESGSLPNPKYTTVTNNNVKKEKQDAQILNDTNISNMPKKSEGMEANLTRTHSSDIQVIKPTSVTPKLSINVFEECVRTVGDVSIAVDGFGMITTDKNTEVVKRFTFTNRNKMQVQVISLGATVTSIKLPDKNGILQDVVLGFDTIEGKFYCSHQIICPIEFYVVNRIL